MYAFTSKLDALTEIFSLENIHENWTSVKVTSAEFLQVISLPEYNLKEQLSLSDSGVANLLKRISSERPTGTKICNALLHKYGLKYCFKCGHVYWLEDFHNNKSAIFGKDRYCKKCFHEYVKPLRTETSARKRAHFIQATPAWADKNKILEIYKKCPAGMHVDHIVPINGELVCGLHVEYNLQYLTAYDNILKSNSFDV